VSEVRDIDTSCRCRHRFQLCCTGYYQLRQLRPLVQYLSEDATKILILAFINTRLYYSNSLYFSIADGLMSRLQSVQNAAAHLITGVRRCEHITPVLRQLHWLPVHRQVDFKISTLVYRSLAGTAPVLMNVHWLLPLATILCGLLTIVDAWSRDYTTSSVTAVLPPPGQHCGTVVCLNNFGNRTSPSDNSNDR